MRYGLPDLIDREAVAVLIWVPSVLTGNQTPVVPDGVIEFVVPRGGVLTKFNKGIGGLHHIAPAEVTRMDDRMERLNQVFRDVFDDDELQITRQTTAKDVEGWDSLMHVTLIVNVEKAFKVKFSSTEVASLQNVGELMSLIDARSPAS